MHTSACSTLMNVSDFLRLSLTARLDADVGRKKALCHLLMGLQGCNYWIGGASKSYGHVCIPFIISKSSSYVCRPLGVIKTPTRRCAIIVYIRRIERLSKVAHYFNIISTSGQHADPLIVRWTAASPVPIFLGVLVNRDENGWKCDGSRTPGNHVTYRSPRYLL